MRRRPELLAPAGTMEKLQMALRYGADAAYLGGEQFGLRAFGEGQALVSVYGALDVMDLGPGEQVIIDTGHVVSYDMGMSVELRQSSSSLWRTVKSGEGFVFLFTGPGRVLLQSRNPRDLNAYITSHSANS